MLNVLRNLLGLNKDKEVSNLPTTSDSEQPMEGMNPNKTSEDMTIPKLATLVDERNHFAKPVEVSEVVIPQIVPSNEVDKKKADSTLIDSKPKSKKKRYYRKPKNPKNKKGE